MSSNADKMLSGLGYMYMEGTDENILWILYGHEYKYEIDFMLKKKEVAYRTIERQKNTIVDVSGMSMQELKAINEKVKELRMDRRRR